ncbi:hypothetical protein [Croceicoccus ponticola]|nr:hypothetical protein [Croceicoccus ponticola]
MLLASVAVAGALSGCVAAAIPVLASGVLTTKAVGKSDTTSADSAARTGQVESVAVIAQPVAAQPAAQTRPGLGSPVAANRTEDFVRMALFAVGNKESGLSVIPDPAASADGPLLLTCSSRIPAILVDLDPGDIALRLDQGAPVAAPGLAPALATARAQGLAVLWTSVLDENRAGDIRDALAASGLDPARRDALLLTRDPAETKTERRNAAAGEWCIKAIVGDRKGDFDALMDYLRDPDAPTPFDELIGNGWFELPPPIEYAA